MKFKQFCFLFLVFPFVSCSQQEEIEVFPSDTSSVIDTVLYTSFYNPDYYQKFDNKWIELEDGLNYIEMDGPYKAKVGDSKISLLKIDPTKFDFVIHSATEVDSVSKCVSDWANLKDLKVVINAGMYDLRRQLYSKGLLVNSKEHANNPKFYEGYNMVIACNPVDKSLPSFDIIDLKCNDFNTVRKQYQTLAQGLRMIDCDGNALSWNKNPQWCSQLVVAKDKKNNIYFVFTRSPYSQNEMIQFMLNLEEPLTNAIYMEGGPQTSLYIDTQADHIEKLGSYVSRTYPTDKNAEFWPLPNIIGIKAKTK